MYQLSRNVDISHKQKKKEKFTFGWVQLFQEFTLLLYGTDVISIIEFR